jgi:predicted SAM-dependent methyltransferase
MKLHLACGSRNFGSDWIHIDGGDYPHVKYKSITDLYAFPNKSVDLIYCSHALEYFDREEKMNTPIKMNFANTATPLRITNSLDDTIIVTVDPDTQQFNISKEGSPIINIGG